MRGIQRLPVNSPYKGQWHKAFTNGWVNNRDICDLKRHRAHYDVTVMIRELILALVCISWRHGWYESTTSWNGKGSMSLEPFYPLRWRHDERDGVYSVAFIQTQIKENIKAPCRWPLCGEFTGDRWIPRTMASNAENVSISWRHHAHMSRRYRSVAHNISWIHRHLCLYYALESVNVTWISNCVRWYCVACKWSSTT